MAARSLPLAFRLALFTALSLAPLTATSQPPENHPPERPPVREISEKDVGPYRPQKTPHLAEVSQRIAEFTNRLREEEKASPVTKSGQLQQTAQGFADYMADNDRYGHEADGKPPADRAKEQGYVLCIISENIAFQFRTTGFRTDDLATQFVDGWAKSPPHRKNMLDPHVTEIGVGVAQSEKTHVFYAVQMFGRPETAAIGFTVANRTRSVASYRIGEQKFDLPPRFVQTHRLCRPAPLTLASAPDAKTQPSQLEPAAGDMFVIQESSNGAISLSRSPR